MAVILTLLTSVSFGPCCCVGKGKHLQGVEEEKFHFVNPTSVYCVMLCILNIFIWFFFIIYSGKHFGAAGFYQEQLVVDGNVSCFRCAEVLLRTFQVLL